MATLRRIRTEAARGVLAGTGAPASVEANAAASRFSNPRFAGLFKEVFEQYPAELLLTRVPLWPVRKQEDWPCMSVITDGE
jgi:hypothetical protein